MVQVLDNIFMELTRTDVEALLLLP
jgi:hypothetical protein